MRIPITLSLLLAFGAACSDDATGTGDGGPLTVLDGGPDAGADAGTDAGVDAGFDGGAEDAGLLPDAGPDAGADAGRDAGEDAGRDAGEDAGRDAGTDAGEDAGHDAGADAGRDAGEDAGLDAGLDAGHDAGTDAGQCLLGASSCEGYTTVRACALDDAGVTVWAVSACPAGSSCLGSSCVTACVDACDLGATEVTDAGTLTCALFDVGAQTTVDAGDGLENRARLYNAFLREQGLPNGEVTYLEYAAADLATLQSYGDAADSAIFTGTYLAAEAWRYKVTGSPDALANVTALVQTLHMLFNVAPQSPGYLARFAAPQDSPAMVTDQFSSSDPSAHFNGSFDGGAYDWLGHISRDQYQGVILGYSVAYDFLTDESLRDLIRSDMVTFVEQLMTSRQICPVIDGIPCFTPFNVQYVVVTPSEPLSITIDTNTQDETVTGLQEFMPVVFGLYPQPTVAIQLTSAFEVALQVTANETAWATQHQAINTFFQANADSWLSTAQLWFDDPNCGTGYFANNIAFEPMFDLARLETNPARLSTILGILAQNMWANGLVNDKDVWFGYIFAADDPTNSLAPAAVTMGNTQLTEFGPAPRVHAAVSNSFPPDPNCPGNALTAIDVGERVVGDFLWQRQPWGESDPGVPTEVFPGVDYLAAYWLGRAEGFLTSDAPTECTLWVP